MADPKGTYYSPQGSETGWATVIPQRPRSNFFRQMAQIPMARAKAQAAEDKAKMAQLSKLSGDQVGRFHYEAYQKEASDLIQNADKYNSLELTDRIVKLNTQAQATKSVEKLYDGDVKWAAGKDVPVKTDAWRAAYTKKYYADPSMESVSKWAEEAPNKTWFLQEDGGSQYIDDGKAIKRVIKNNFDGYLTDQQWKRSGWEKAPTGHVADMLTYKKKINAFSTVEKGPDGNDQIVIKDPKDLISEGILTTFMEDEFMGRVLTDKAKALLSSEKGGAVIEDEDVSQFDLARALQQQLVPYIDGAISESGMTLSIRPLGGGGGGGKDEKFQKGFDLWVYQVSQGAPAAIDFPKGGKMGNAEIIAFGRDTSSMDVYANEASLRKAWSKQAWFNSMTPDQKAMAVDKVMHQSNSTFDPNNKPTAFYTLVTREKTTPDPNAKNPSAYQYSVEVFNPETANRSMLSLLYTAGLKARGNTHYDAVVQKGQAGYEFESEQPKTWTPPKTATAPVTTKPKGM